MRGRMLTVADDGPLLQFRRCAPEVQRQKPRERGTDPKIELVSRINRRRLLLVEFMEPSGGFDDMSAADVR